MGQRTISSRGGSREFVPTPPPTNSHLHQAKKSCFGHNHAVLVSGYKLQEGLSEEYGEADQTEVYFEWVVLIYGDRG